jgi:hypothetical protein
MGSNRRADEFDFAQEYVNEVLRPFLPNANSSGFKLSNGVWEEFPLDSVEQFRGSCLDYDTFIDDKCSLIHFTSINSFLSIVQSKELRLNALENLSDTEEWNHLMTKFELNLDDPDIKNFKSCLFSFSTCENNSDNIRNEQMWCEYADKGNGLIIELEVDKYVQSAYLSFLGKIQYTNEMPNELQELKRRHNAFASRHRVGKNVIATTLNALASFYKSHFDFSHENEIRILNYLDKSPYETHYDQAVKYTYNSDLKKLKVL